MLSSSRKVQLQRSEDKRTALTASDRKIESKINDLMDNKWKKRFLI